MSLVFFSLSPICLLPLSAFFSLYLPSSTSAISISYCFFLSLLNLLFPSHSPESSLSFSLSWILSFPHCLDWSECFLDSASVRS
jgi:hypothetical protein